MKTSENIKMVSANFKIPVDLREAVEDLAQKRGTTFSRVIRDSLNVFIHLDAPVWPAILEKADTYGLPESKIVQNIILKYMGETQAMDECYGIDDQRIVTEFSRTRNGATLESDELIAEAKKTYSTMFKLFIDMNDYITEKNKDFKAEDIKREIDK